MSLKFLNMKNIIEQLKELKDNLDSKARECDKLRKSYESQGEYLTAINYSLMRGAFEYGAEGIEEILNERNSVDDGEKSFATCDACESYYYCKFHKQCKLYWKKMTSK